MSYPEHSDSTLVEIYLRDLTEEAQSRIAKELGMTVDELWNETNWDVFSMAQFEIQNKV